MTQKSLLLVIAVLHLAKKLQKLVLEEEKTAQLLYQSIQYLKNANWLIQIAQSTTNMLW